MANQPTKTPQQDPLHPNNDPGQNTPKIPQGPGDNQPLHPDPNQQPIDRN